MPDEYSKMIQIITHPGIALALGLLVGSKRGWYGRNRKSGERSTGVRTFTLLALLGRLVY